MMSLIIQLGSRLSTLHNKIINHTKKLIVQNLFLVSRETEMKNLFPSAYRFLFQNQEKGTQEYEIFLQIRVGSSCKKKSYYTTKKCTEVFWLVFPLKCCEYFLLLGCERFEITNKTARTV